MLFTGRIPLFAIPAEPRRGKSRDPSGRRSVPDQWAARVATLAVRGDNPNGPMIRDGSC
jgi:hypothetical protein